MKSREYLWASIPWILPVNFSFTMDTDFSIKHPILDGRIPCIDFPATHDFKENFGSESHSLHETVFQEMLSIINILKERSFRASNLKVVT
ncbi:hypothetical protein CEXT_271921 [Caerostris extrusa]|uniref:Uncharacterized protein n=1 Tax=Caerostris extrusa TaxID=172846 RepID=A0AAV4NPV7_CAEEX|nr:hypothetical protein CEXT_271921 [Caerostris extrusa]